MLLAELEADASQTYRQLVEDLAADMPIDRAEIQKICLLVGTTIRALADDVSTIKARHAAAVDLQRAAELAEQARELDGKAHEADTALAAANAEARGMVARATAESQAAHAAASELWRQQRTLESQARRVLLATADPGVDEQIAALGRQRAALENDAHENRTFGNEKSLAIAKARVSEWEGHLRTAKAGREPGPFCGSQKPKAELVDTCEKTLLRMQEHVAKLEGFARQTDELDLKARAIDAEIGRVVAVKLDPSRGRLSVAPLPSSEKSGESRVTGGLGSASSASSKDASVESTCA